MAATTLREIIEAGENPLDGMPHPPTDRIAHLGDLLLSAVGTRDQRERERESVVQDFAQYLRTSAEDLPADFGPEDEAALARTIARVELLDRWTLELLDDPSLVARVIEAIPDPVDRLQLEHRMDRALRGYPLEVDEPGGEWTCDGCGGIYEADQPVVVIGCPAGETDVRTIDGYEPCWCVDCLEEVAARARARGAVRRPVGSPSGERRSDP